MQHRLKTASGVVIDYQEQAIPYKDATKPLIERLDNERGALLASDFNCPGRYTCWDIGFVNPPIAITAKAHTLSIQALNARGSMVQKMMHHLLNQTKNIEISTINESQFTAQTLGDGTIFSEEARSKQPSIFTILRALQQGLHVANEPYLGLYGAFGYDLIFQFEALVKHQQRQDSQRDMVLYLPDELYVVDHHKEQAFIRRYDFMLDELSTQGLARTGTWQAPDKAQKPPKEADHLPGEYAALVEKAKHHFIQGDLFEVVPSQTFYASCTAKPSVLLARLRQNNPSPYGFLVNLGEGEYLVGSSPEMFVRVTNSRVETCPISGTIKRGNDALEDAKNIQALLDNEKEAAELTMCTDVDRNDKSRVCVAGSVKVIARRQIELYSTLIHTVDHVEGVLRPGFDALDAFLTHMWVVTVTGAPKLWAMQFIEQHERSPRKWYGGAVGVLGLNGDLNTGLILRTLRIEQGIAEIRTGATLLYDSIPQAEEAETRLKAQALLNALTHLPFKPLKSQFNQVLLNCHKKVLLIDHQDSFVHTLANYIRQTGAEVQTVRREHALFFLKNEQVKFDLVVLSPGPGRPRDFDTHALLDYLATTKQPVFGVCLGLQAMVEFSGGVLALLPKPVHGRAADIIVLDDSDILKGLKPEFVAGRYHSLVADKAKLPAEIIVTAKTKDELIMAIRHIKYPWYAVQFHPETILSLAKNAGQRIINNLMLMI
ncbi:MAG: anthranilate synthase component I [Legionellaceae bacterium]|nr:anthranilate synthase component I [Legionellaceae bacterium]HAF87261.1 anthranilate synthase component I [Legionellales bacterium]HCA89470.1 anthranilate synthase component I [Legionellales bacterium]|tara:strand:+ start:5321 stop:7462 length:2142 start_codon:yes stop_codon:yes gene_type:complete